MIKTVVFDITYDTTNRPDNFAEIPLYHITTKNKDFKALETDCLDLPKAMKHIAQEMEKHSYNKVYGTPVFRVK